MDKQKPEVVENVLTSLDQSKDVKSTRYIEFNEGYKEMLNNCGFDRKGSLGEKYPIVTLEYVEKDAKGSFSSPGNKVLKNHENVEKVNTYTINDLVKHGSSERERTLSFILNSKNRRADLPRKFFNVIRLVEGKIGLKENPELENRKRHYFIHDIKFSDS